MQAYISVITPFRLQNISFAFFLDRIYECEYEINIIVWNASCFRDEILLKKNLVDPAEHDGKDPDVIPPQNVYCAEMEQAGGIPNMLLPPNGT